MTSDSNDLSKSATTSLNGVKAAAADKISDIADEIATKTQRAKESANASIGDTAAFLRDDVPTAFEQASTAGLDAGERLAQQFTRGLQTAADYVRQFDIDANRERASTLIRRYPLRAMGLGVLGGFLLSRKLRR